MPFRRRLSAAPPHAMLRGYCEDAGACSAVGLFRSHKPARACLCPAFPVPVLPWCWDDGVGCAAQWCCDCACACLASTCQNIPLLHLLCRDAGFLHVMPEWFAGRWWVCDRCFNLRLCVRSASAFWPSHFRKPAMRCICCDRMLRFVLDT